jgi:uncharacterized protein VirK/YbjX
MTLLKQLADLFAAGLKAAGWASAASRVLGGAQALRFARMHAELLAQPVFRHFIATSENNDPPFYLSHRHYLSKRLSYRQRIGYAVTHYAYEGSRHSKAYRDAVYQDGGLALWSKAVNGAQYSIRLCATINPRNEGGNSIRLSVDACAFARCRTYGSTARLSTPRSAFPP